VIALLGSVVTASLLGSPHCAAMCGGFVCFYSGEGKRAGLLAHAAYHGSRLLGYATLGALAGAMGAGLDRAGAWGGVNRTAAIVSGTLLLLWGAAALAGALGARLPILNAPRWAHGTIGRALKALRDQPPAARAAAIGALSGLLPCGWLYAYVTVAAGTGSPLTGMLVMLAFWLGTVPMLAGVGVAARGLMAPLGRRLPMATAVLMMLFGALALAGKLGPLTARAGGGGATNAAAPACEHCAPAVPKGASHGGH
jgi:sulfite exporter TauE/SafE